MKTIRKGAKVRYIGDKELGQGREFTVLRKSGNWVDIMFPVRYMGGDIHMDKTSLPLTEFELA